MHSQILRALWMPYISSVICVCLAAAWTLPLANAQTSPDRNQRREMTAVRLEPSERIHLDGVFDEPVWQRAQ